MYKYGNRDVRGGILVKGTAWVKAVRCENLGYIKKHIMDKKVVKLGSI